MQKDHRPHDELFKTTFSIKEVVEEYINVFLPKNISKHLDTESLKLEPVSYLTPELKANFSDLVYSCQWKKNTSVKLSLLFEHKSNLPDFVFLQLLRYIIGHLENCLKQKKPLTVMIPIILYHGKGGWQPRKMEDFFGKIDKELRRFLPIFEYHLTDLSKFSDEDIEKLNVVYLMATLLLFKHYDDEKYILTEYTKVFIKMEDEIDSDVGENFTISILVYILKALQLKEKPFNEFAEQLPSKIKDITMSTYDYLIQKGEKKGEKKGKKEGIKEGKKEAVIGLLKKFPKMSDKEIAEIINVQASFVKELRKEFKKKK